MHIRILAKLKILSERTLISFLFEPFQQHAKPDSHTKCVDCYVCMVVWIDCIIFWSSFQSMLIWNLYLCKYVLGMSESQEPKLGGFPSKSERTKPSEFLLWFFPISAKYILLDRYFTLSVHIAQLSINSIFYRPIDFIHTTHVRTGVK